VVQTPVGLRQRLQNWHLLLPWLEICGIVLRRSVTLNPAVSGPVTADLITTIIYSYTLLITDLKPVHSLTHFSPKPSVVNLLFKQLLLKNRLTSRELSPFHGGGIVYMYLYDPDSYAGWSFFTPGRASQVRQVEG